MARGDYCIVWEFRVRAEHVGAFEEHYGPAGTWARFFSRGDGFRGTTLLRASLDARSELRYLTIDRWESEAARDAFLEAHREAYDALDSECAALTLEEREIGRFSDVLE